MKGMASYDKGQSNIGSGSSSSVNLQGGRGIYQKWQGR